MNKMKIINSKLFYWYDRFFIKPNFKQKQYQKVNDFSYEKLIDGFDIKPNSQIFVHAGLKSIKLLTGDGYKEIIENLNKAIKTKYNCNAIIAPSFTPSFRKTGVYSKNFSKGEYGVFSELPRHQANFRTDDAIHGVAIFTDDVKKFENFNYHDTFANDGFYASLKENTYILNVCTNWFVSTYMHYIEEELKVPYKKVGGLKSKGVLLDESNNPKDIVQNNHHYLFKSEINREKVKKVLEKDDVLKWNSYNDLKSSCVKVSDLDKVLRENMINNPYYLVSF